MENTVDWFVVRCH